MLANQKTDCICLVFFQSKPDENIFDGLQSSDDVIVARDSLAYIVEEQRKKEQLGLFEFRINLGQRTFPIVRRAFQAVNVLNGDKRVRVNGVVMVKIANDQ